MRRTTGHALERSALWGSNGLAPGGSLLACRLRHAKLRLGEVQPWQWLVGQTLQYAGPGGTSLTLTNCQPSFRLRHALWCDWRHSHGCDLRLVLKKKAPHEGSGGASRADLKVGENQPPGRAHSVIGDNCEM